MIPRNVYLLMVVFLFTNCSTHFESTSEEKKMDIMFEKKLVKELNKIRRVKGLHEIQTQKSVDEKRDKNPFDAQMRRGY